MVGLVLGLVAGFAGAGAVACSFVSLFLAIGASRSFGKGFFPGLNGFSFGFSVGLVLGLVAGFAGAGAVACSLVSRLFTLGDTGFLPKSVFLLGEAGSPAGRDSEITFNKSPFVILGGKCFSTIFSILVSRNKDNGFFPSFNCFFTAITHLSNFLVFLGPTCA